MLSWANRFNICCLLDNHYYPQRYAMHECLLAAGAAAVYAPLPGQALQNLNAFIARQGDWLFGHLCYDLKNETEPGLQTRHGNTNGFPDLFFFQPEMVLSLSAGILHIESLSAEPQWIFDQVRQQQPALPATPFPPPSFQARMDKTTYLHKLRQLQQHILRGDCYEINFCQEFYTTAGIDPAGSYLQLTALSPTPFAAFYKLNHLFLLCASPERYLLKKGHTLVSQPIKGTVKRNSANPLEDELLQQQLYNSAKDRSENVMVVDLVRNDLSKICEKGSVSTEELFGIYSFPRLHQMISTITGRLKKGTGLAEILQASFPMGSMTGAPKKRVMQLADQYEENRRGLYAGSVGYITPEQDFDFNVVIRSLQYNAIDRYLSYQVGGGITFYSDPEKEYEECLLKAAAIREALQ